MNRRAQFLPLRDVNDSTGTSPVNWSLIILNVLIFLVSWVALDSVVSAYGFTPTDFSFFTMLTSMFLHGGFMHLLGNMWFLYIFGDNVEHALGHVKYLLFYLFAGVAATLTHFLLNMHSSIPAVGASGAISGVLGAYVVLYPRARVHVMGGLGVGEVSAKFMLLIWFGYQFISGVLGYFGADSGVAFWAHVGGFVFGVVAAWVYRAFTR